MFIHSKHLPAMAVLIEVGNGSTSIVSEFESRWHLDCVEGGSGGAAMRTFGT
jgi:hypothetical protein